MKGKYICAWCIYIHTRTLSTRRHRLHIPKRIRSQSESFGSSCDKPRQIRRFPFFLILFSFHPWQYICKILLFTLILNRNPSTFRILSFACEGPIASLRFPHEIIEFDPMVLFGGSLREFYRHCLEQKFRSSSHLEIIVQWRYEIAIIRDFPKI